MLRLLFALIPPLFFIRLIIPLPFGETYLLKEKQEYTRGYNEDGSPVPYFLQIDRSVDKINDIKDYLVSNPLKGLMNIGDITFKVCVVSETTYKDQENLWIVIEHDAANVRIHDKANDFITLKSDENKRRCVTVQKELHDVPYLYVDVHFWEKYSEGFTKRLKEHDVLMRDGEPDEFKADFYVDVRNKVAVTMTPTYNFSWLVVWLAAYLMWFGFLLTSVSVGRWVSRKRDQ